MTPTDPAIEAIGITKSFGSTMVLCDLTLAVPGGSVFALLGPNGAGKTTTVRILATLTRPDGGRARVCGLDVVARPRQVRSVISLTGQFAAVDGNQTGAENLRMAARLAGLTSRQAKRRAAELLDQFDLTEAADRRSATYSGGMRRRLDLAAGLVSWPEVVFLDEPTTGLDIAGRQVMWKVITGLAGRGVTIFLTTQYLEEADRLADRVAVLNGGRVAAAGSPQALKDKVGGRRLVMEMASAELHETALLVLGRRVIAEDSGSLTIAVATDGQASHVRTVLDEVDPDRRAVRAFTVHDTTLDAVFLALTSRTAVSAQMQKEPGHV